MLGMKPTWKKKVTKQMFSMFKADKGLASIIYKELVQINEKTGNPLSNTSEEHRQF